MSNQRDKLNDRDNILTIIQSCDKILSYTEGMEWDDFIQKSYIVDACAMNCLVIGERAAKLSYEFRQYYDGLPWIELENFRHRTAHIYGTDTFDLRILCPRSSRIYRRLWSIANTCWMITIPITA